VASFAEGRFVAARLTPAAPRWVPYVALGLCGVVVLLGVLIAGSWGLISRGVIAFTLIGLGLGGGALLLLTRRATVPSRAVRDRSSLPTARSSASARLPPTSVLPTEAARAEAVEEVMFPTVPVRVSMESVTPPLATGDELWAAWGSSEGEISTPLIGPVPETLYVPPSPGHSDPFSSRAPTILLRRSAWSPTLLPCDSEDDFLLEEAVAEGSGPSGAATALSATDVEALMPLPPHLRDSLWAIPEDPELMAASGGSADSLVGLLSGALASEGPNRLGPLGPTPIWAFGPANGWDEEYPSVMAPDEGQRARAEPTVVSASHRAAEKARELLDAGRSSGRPGPSRREQPTDWTSETRLTPPPSRLRRTSP